MVTNKGIFMAALALGLCIIVASIINSAAICKSSRMNKGGAAWGCQMGGERDGGDRRGGREGMRGNCGKPDEPCENMRGERGERRAGMRGNRGERSNWREGMRGERQGRGRSFVQRGEHEDNDERGGRRGWQRNQRGGGGGEVTQCPKPEEACTGNGYLFN